LLAFILGPPALRQRPLGKAQAAWLAMVAGMSKRIPRIPRRALIQSLQTRQSAQ
jgi:hypothetical protein